MQLAFHWELKVNPMELGQFIRMWIRLRRKLAVGTPTVQPRSEPLAENWCSSRSITGIDTSYYGLLDRESDYLPQTGGSPDPALDQAFINLGYYASLTGGDGSLTVDRFNAVLAQALPHLADPAFGPNGPTLIGPAG